MYVAFGRRVFKFWFLEARVRGENKMNAGLRSTQERLVGDCGIGERDRHAFQLGPGKPVDLLVEQRHEQSFTPQDRLDLAIDAVADDWIGLCATSDDQIIQVGR